MTHVKHHVCNNMLSPLFNTCAKVCLAYIYYPTSNYHCFTELWESTMDSTTQPTAQFSNGHAQLVAAHGYIHTTCQALSRCEAPLSCTTFQGLTVKHNCTNCQAAVVKLIRTRAHIDKHKNTNSQLPSLPKPITHIQLSMTSLKMSVTGTPVFGVGVAWGCKQRMYKQQKQQQKQQKQQQAAGSRKQLPSTNGRIQRLNQLLSFRVATQTLSHHQWSHTTCQALTSDCL